MTIKKLYNLARVTTTTVGTGTINLGSAVPGALTFADAGVQDDDVVSYSIKDGTASEVGRGTYSSTGPTLARTTVLKSTNGDSAISLTGNNAEVFITALAEDFDVTGNLAGGFWTSSDVASAATCDIGAATTPCVRITGTTTVTSLGTQPNRIRFVEFTGSLTLTYNGTSLILPGTTNIITQAGDKGIFISDASGNWRCISWTPVMFTPREKLTTDRTYYVRTDGSDNNNGLTNTSSGAFLTIQKAITIAYSLDWSIYRVTIQVGAGTFIANLIASAPFLASQPLLILGDTVTPSNVVIKVSSGNGNQLSGGAQIEVSGVTLDGATAFCSFNVVTGGKLIIGTSVVFVGTPSFAHVYVANGGFATFFNPFTVSGSAASVVRAEAGGTIDGRAGAQSVTLVGTPNFSNGFAYAQLNGVILFAGKTFSGSATGPRYFCGSGGVIFTNGGGASFFPGNSAGSGGTSTGGGYYV